MTTPSDAFSRMTPEQIDGAITEIDRISQHIRTNWFALIGLFAFAGVTLLSVEDVDFFAFGRQTTLPLIGISIPTKSFFWVAPPLIAAVFVYFHLSLLGLWDALATVPPKVKSVRLSRAIFPTLISNFALSLRPDRAVPQRALRPMTNAIVVALVWLTIPGVLVYFWLRSMPMHDLWMTLFIGLCVAVSTLVGLVSAVVAGFRLRTPGPRLRTLPRLLTGKSAFAGLFIFVIFCAVSFETTQRHWLVPADMFGEQLVERPDHWRDRTTARAAYKHKWCSQRTIPFSECKSLEGELLKAFAPDWMTERNAVIAALDSLDLEGADLREADLRQSFLVGVTLNDANLAGADLRGANLERADLRGANLEGANLRRANLEGVDFQEANLERANLREANLAEADLTAADLRSSDLGRANLAEADLTAADLRSSDLGRANLEGAILKDTFLYEARAYTANFEGADLTDASFDGAGLGGANFKGAVLKGVDFEGAELWEANFEKAELSYANLSGADLSMANLKGAMLDGAYLKGAKLDLAYLKGVTLKSADLDGVKFWAVADLEEANLDGLDLRGKNIGKTKLPRASLIGADLRGENLKRVNFSGANLHDAKLADANLEQATLLEAILSSANLRRANLLKAELSGARLGGADLREVNLAEADLSEADLEWARLSGAVLVGADLTGANLEGATLLEANLLGANLRGANLKWAEGLEQSQLIAAFGDWNTSLTAGTVTERPLFVQDPSVHRTDHWWTLYMSRDLGMNPN